jgi:hypothetical protein
MIANSWPKLIITADWFNCGTTEDGIKIINATTWLDGEE